MEVLGALLLFLFAYGIDYWNGKVDGVDYWKQGKGKEEAKEDRAFKYFEESRNWFPENVSPIERYFYSHPNDRKAWEYLYRYYEERTERANALQTVVLYMQAREEEKLRDILGKVEVLYFYSPRCPYCRATEPLVGKLSELTNVYRIDVGKAGNLKYVRRYGVVGTPTLVFVRRGTEEEVGRWVGIAYWGRSFKSFLLRLGDKL